MRCSASAQSIKEVTGNFCASGKTNIFFIEGKTNNWSLLICLANLIRRFLIASYMFQKIIKFLILFCVTATFVKEICKYVKSLAFTPHLNIPSITTLKKKKITLRHGLQTLCMM